MFLGVSLVVSDWGASKARRERVESVVGVVLVLVVHGGYCDDHVPHYHHYHHCHPHPRRRQPTVTHFPNWEVFEPTPMPERTPMMRGSSPIGRRGSGRLTPYPSWNRRGWQRLQIRGQVIDAHLIKGLVDQVLVPRVQNFLHGAWGHLFGGGRADPGRGHGVVRLWRKSVIIGHTRFSKVRSMVSWGSNPIYRRF